MREKLIKNIEQVTKNIKEDLTKSINNDKRVLNIEVKFEIGTAEYNGMPILYSIKKNRWQRFLEEE